MFRLPEAPQETEARGVRAPHRVVVAVPVAVVVLQVERVLHEGVGLHEDPERRIEEPPVHVHDAHIVQVLVPREAAVGAGVDGRAPVHDQGAEAVVGAVGVAALTEGVVGVARGHRAVVVGGRDQAAQVVLVPVLQLDDGDAREHGRRGLACAQGG